MVIRFAGNRSLMGFVSFGALGSFLDSEMKIATRQNYPNVYVMINFLMSF
jgi:hypothetical protein